MKNVLQTGLLAIVMMFGIQAIAASGSSIYTAAPCEFPPCGDGPLTPPPPPPPPTPIFNVVTLSCGTVTFPDAVNPGLPVQTFDGASNGFSARAAQIVAVPFVEGGYRLFIVDNNCNVRSWRGNGNLSAAMTDLPGSANQGVARWQGWEFFVNGIFELNGDVLVYGFGEMNHPDGAFTLPFAPSLNVPNGTTIPLFWNITKNVWNNPALSDAQLFGGSVVNDGGLPIIDGDTSNVQQINSISTNALGWTLACDDRGCEVINSAPIVVGSCSDVSMPADFAYPVDVAVLGTGRFTQNVGLVTGYKKDGTAGFWIVNNSCNANGIGINPLTIDAPLEILGAPRENNWVYEVLEFTNVNRGRFSTTVTLSAKAVNYDGYDLDGERLSCSGAAIAEGESFDIEYNFSILNFTNTTISILPTTFCNFDRCGVLDAWIIGCSGANAKGEIQESSGWFAPADSYTLIDFYPNPTTDKLTISSNVEGAMQVQLSDLMGRILLSEQVENNQDIRVAHLPKGVYVITVTSDNGHRHTDRVIIQ